MTIAGERQPSGFVFLNLRNCQQGRAAGGAVAGRKEDGIRQGGADQGLCLGADEGVMIHYAAGQGQLAAGHARFADSYRKGR